MHIYSENAHVDEWSLMLLTIYPGLVHPTCVWSKLLLSPCDYHNLK